VCGSRQKQQDMKPSSFSKVAAPAGRDGAAPREGSRLECRFRIPCRYLLSSFRNPCSVIPDCVAAGVGKLSNFTSYSTFQPVPFYFAQCHPHVVSANLLWLIYLKQKLSTLLYRELLT